MYDSSSSVLLMLVVLNCERCLFLFILGVVVILLHLLLLLLVVAILGLFVALALLLQVLIESLVAILLTVIHAEIISAPNALLRHGSHLSFSVLSLFGLLAGLQSVSLHTSIHLWEQETQYAFAILPLQIIQVDLVRESLCRILRNSIRRGWLPAAHAIVRPLIGGAHLWHRRWICHLSLLLFL